MVTEVKAGVGSNRSGSLSKVVSEYKLSKGTTLVAVKGASHTTKGNKVFVTTEYSASLSFKIVVREDERVVIYPFTHVREVEVPAGKTDINSVAATVRPELDVVEQVVPDLEEINLDLAPIPRVGF